MNWRQLKNMDRDDLLNIVGLETKRDLGDWVIPTLSAFSIGVLVGAGVGLLLAPRAGRELRDDLKNRLQGGQGVSPGLSSIGASAGDTKSRTL